MAEKTRDIRVYANREDSYASKERLHEGKVCLQLGRKDLTEFKSQDMSFTGIKTLPNGRVFVRIKL